MTRLILATTLLLSAVVWYLGLTWCAPAFLAIAGGCVLAIVQAWRMAGRVTRGPRSDRKVHDNGRHIWVCYSGSPCYAPVEVHCECRGPVEPEPKIAKGES